MEFWIRKGPTKTPRKLSAEEIYTTFKPESFKRANITPTKKTANHKFSGLSNCFEEIHPHEFFVQQPSNAATKTPFFFVSRWLETIRTAPRPPAWMITRQVGWVDGLGKSAHNRHNPNEWEMSTCFTGWWLATNPKTNIGQILSFHQLQGEF